MLHVCTKMFTSYRLGIGFLFFGSGAIDLDLTSTNIKLDLYLIMLYMCTKLI